LHCHDAVDKAVTVLSKFADSQLMMERKKMRWLSTLETVDFVVNMKHGNSKSPHFG
jgi:hypothetical protein